MRDRRRTVSIATASTLGAVAVTITACALRPICTERWYLWKLESDDSLAWPEAAEKLAEMQSFAAVEGLRAALRREGASLPELDNLRSRIQHRKALANYRDLAGVEWDPALQSIVAAALHEARAYLVTVRRTRHGTVRNY